MQKQLEQTAQQAIEELESRCSWGCKRNSQGNPSYWKGYKLHLDVTDNGIPVSAIVTGANVHDSQVAIPLERMTEQRVNHLYSLMDSAYDAKPIRDFITDNGRIPIIDPNKRRKQQRVLSPSEKQHFKIRSTVERSNSHLKDWLIPPKINGEGVPLPDDRRAVPCSDQDTAVLHPTGHPENGVTPQRAMMNPPIKE